MIRRTPRRFRSPARRIAAAATPSSAATLQTLEARQMLAGNVAASFTGRTFRLTGDAADNALDVTVDVAGGEVTVAGRDGTTVNGRPTLTLDLPAGGVVSNAVIRMGRGDDSLTVLGGGAALSGGVLYDGESGDDIVQMFDLSARSDISINGGSGVNAAVLSGLLVGDDLRIDGDGEADLAFVADVRVGDDLTYGGSQGQDALFLGDVRVADDLKFKGRGGDDAFVGGGLYIVDKTEIDTGSGDDFVGLLDAIDLPDLAFDFDDGENGGAISLFGDDVDVDLESGDDALFTRGAHRFGDDLITSGGSGFDVADVDRPGRVDRLKFRRFESTADIEDDFADIGGALLADLVDAAGDRGLDVDLEDILMGGRPELGGGEDAETIVIDNDTGTADRSAIRFMNSVPLGMFNIDEPTLFELEGFVGTTGNGQFAQVDAGDAYAFQIFDETDVTLDVSKVLTDVNFQVVRMNGRMAEIVRRYTRRPGTSGTVQDTLPAGRYELRVRDLNRDLQTPSDQAAGQNYSVRLGIGADTMVGNGDSDNGDSDNGDSDNGDSDNGDSENGDSGNGGQGDSTSFSLTDDTVASDQSSRSSAAVIGDIAGFSSGTVAGFVGRRTITTTVTDANDLYEFSLSGERDISVQFESLSSPLTFDLLDDSGTVLDSTGAVLTESDDFTLPAGTYQLRISGTGDALTFVRSYRVDVSIA